MWSKIGKRLGIYLAAAFLLFAAIDWYEWYSTRQVRADARRFVADSAARSKALEAMGDVRLETADLTRAKLQSRLGNPGMRLAATSASSRLGWACAAKDCLIWATFAVPQEQEIAQDAVALGLTLNDPYGFLFGSKQRVSIDGARLGESVAEAKESARKRGYGKDMGSDRISWNRNWSGLILSGPKDQVVSLVFLNDSALSRLRDDQNRADRGADLKAGTDRN